MSGDRRFAREIEARWSSLLGRPVVLGERDWELICDWHAREIPLGLVVEAMEALGEKLARRRSRPRNLGALAPLVEEAWRTVLEGRIQASGKAPVAAAPATEHWRRRAASLPEGDRLRSRLEGLLAELAAGAAPDDCDLALDRELRGLMEPELLEALSAAVEANLAGFRDRMAPATWKETVERALITAARRRLDLPHLGG